MVLLCWESWESHMTSQLHVFNYIKPEFLITQENDDKKDVFISASFDHYMTHPVLIKNINAIDAFLQTRQSNS